MTLMPSQTLEEALIQIEKVLKTLQANNLTLNLTKCRFLKKKIDYISREIPEEGVRPGVHKLEVVLKTTDLQNVKQVRQFLGLAGYFCKFIHDFARKVASFTNLLRKTVPRE